MKKMLVCMVLLSLYCTSQAQTRIALIGGVNSADARQENLPDSLVDGYENRTGFKVGFLFDIPLGTSMSFQPSIAYSQKGRKLQSDNSTHSPNLLGQYTNYLDIPLNLVFKLGGENTKFLIGGGPYIGWLISGREKTGTTQRDELPKGDGVGQYEGFDYGWNALAGVEFNRVFLTANYSRGLSNFYNPARYGENYRHAVLGATLGIYLNRGTPKVRDRDNDGITDAEDECPDEPGTAVTKGCPDRDSDGIADKNDKCPDQTGTSKYEGCPVPDTDNDGINDELDKCPTQAGTSKYNGCPIPDTDNDGINDELDRCPNQAGEARNNGCPISDTDRDGLNDEEDQCPSQAGIRENNGCPEINQKLVDRVSTDARRITFSGNASTLSVTSKKTLDGVAEVLQQNPDLSLTVGVHAADNGNSDAALTLTENRAQAIKAYMESKGIASDRVRVQGYGSTQPISSGTTAAERAKNTRVELKLSNH